MVADSNVVSNVIGDQLSKHGIGLLLGALTLAGTFAIVVDRGNTGELRWNTTNARLDEQERDARLYAEKQLRTELAVQTLTKDIATIIAQADARNDSQDVRQNDNAGQIKELQATDRELDRWRAGLTVSLVNMQQQLERVVLLIEQRLPDNSSNGISIPPGRK